MPAWIGVRRRYRRRGDAFGPEHAVSFDILIEGGTVLTLDAERRIVEGDVLLRGGRIERIGPHGSLKPKGATQTVDARGCLVMPGFVQAHVHLCQTLFRGHAEQLQLLDWLSQRIWPFEGAHDERSLAASSALGIAELLLGGTTCALDMGTVQHTDTIFEVAAEMGIRLVSGKAMMDKGHMRPGGLKETTTDSLTESVRLAEKWHGAADGRLRYAFAPRFILSCTDELLRDAVKEARRLGCLLHTHASENPGEVEAVREATGKDNVEALHDLGLSGRDVVLAHCVWVTAGEQRILRETGTGVAHCPSTNLKLGSGVARIPELLEQGVRIGIGADGAPCNNRMSAFSEMRLAALLQKPRVGTEAMPASDVVWLATRGGARLLGLEDDIGSLEKGKKADVVVVDTRRPHLRPKADPYSTLVYAAEAADVRHVFVDGRWLVRERELVGVEMGDVLDGADAALAAVAGRAGVDFE